MSASPKESEEESREKKNRKQHEQMVEVNEIEKPRATNIGISIYKKKNKKRRTDVQNVTRRRRKG